MCKCTKERKKECVCDCSYEKIEEEGKVLDPVKVEKLLILILELQNLMISNPIKKLRIRKHIMFVKRLFENGEQGSLIASGLSENAYSPVDNYELSGFEIKWLKLTAKLFDIFE